MKKLKFVIKRLDESIDHKRLEKLASMGDRDASVALRKNRERRGQEFSHEHDPLDVLIDQVPSVSWRV